MTLKDWITLAVAIVGVLHGPLVPMLFGKAKQRKAKP